MSQVINRAYGQGIEIIRKIMDKETVDGLKQYLAESYDGDREMSARAVYEWVERLSTMDEAIPHLETIYQYMADAEQWYYGTEAEPITMPEDCGEWDEDELDLQACIDTDNAIASVHDWAHMCADDMYQFSTWMSEQHGTLIENATNGAYLCIEGARLAQDVGEYDANEMAFDAWMRCLVDLDASIEVNDACDAWDKMDNESQTLQHLIQSEEECQQAIADEAHRAEMWRMDAQDEADGHSWQCVATLMIHKLIQPCGNGRYCHTLPNTHRIELIGTVKGKQIVQRFKTIMPHVWAQNWQARIVVLPA